MRRHPQLLLLLAFVGSVLASSVPIYLSFGELGDVRESTRRIADTAQSSRSAQTIADAVTDTLGQLAALRLPAEPLDHALNLRRADRQMAVLTAGLQHFLDNAPGALAKRDLLALSASLAATREAWQRTHGQLLAQRPPGPAEHPIGAISQELHEARDILRGLVAHAAVVSDSSSKSIFEHLGLAGMLLLGAVTAGFVINAFGSVSVFKALRASNEANLELSAAKSKLRKRTDRLSEAHRLGGLFDWRVMFDEQMLRCSRAAFELLGHPQDRYPVPLATVYSFFVGDGLERVREVQREVLSSHAPRSLDVQFRRADGAIRDFTLTCEAMLGPDGKPIGVFGTGQDITARKAAEKRLEAIAYYDALTGLGNRALFARRIDEVLARAAQKNLDTSLLLLDLDRFKEVNDALGHAAGDELLIRAGKLISVVVADKHFVARLGGDEFAIIVSEQMGPIELEALARELITVLSGHVLLQRGEVGIGTSIGIATAPTFGATATDLLRNADLALYKAKECGRGRFAFFTPDLDTAMQRKVALAKDLRQAINKNSGLSTCFQPQVELSSGRVVGFEALLRWNHPARGDVSPSEFVPIAETSGLICPLGNWVLREASMQAKTWLDQGLPPRQVSVNVSVAQIWHSDFVETVAQVLKETKLPPHLLCLELTESLMADHSEGRVRNALKALKGLGVTLALDDFGTHYSLLGYLAQLPIDKLKIDRVFVHGVSRSHRSCELLKGIIALGRGLGMTVLAEGAETPQEVAILRAAGCDQVQGHAFSRAISAEAAAQYAIDRELIADDAAQDAPDGVDEMVASLRAAVA